MARMPRSNEQGVRLRDLRVLEVVLREHSLTRAADQLDTSQPTLSKVLARLRGQFGDPLFVRDGQTMRPTPRAMELAAPLHALIQAADGIRRPLRGPFDAAASERTFRLLLSDVGMLWFLPPLAARLAVTAPRVILEAVPLDARQFAAKLASGEADLALGAYPNAPRGLRRQLLYIDKYICIARPEHPELRRLRSPAGFRRARHILVAASGTGHGAHEVAQRTLETVISPDRILLRLPSFVAAALVASRSDGVAIVPANLARALTGLRLAIFRPPIAIPPIEVSQYWHERFQRDPGHRWLRATSFALFGRGRPRS
jgi:DNA-binding transcriptional LysR family regulator